MTEDELTAIIEQFQQVVTAAHETQNQYLTMMMEAHLAGDHHQFVRMEISRNLRRQQIWDKVHGSFIFWILIGVTGTIGMIVWDHLKN